jgi:hypothetical protein
MMIHGLAKPKKKNVYCVGVFPWNKWAESKGDHLPISDAEVKNEWNYT